MTQRAAPTRPPLPVVLLISLAQGLALLALWRALEGGAWPSRQPVFNFPLWTIAVAAPALLLLGLEGRRQSRALALVAGFCALLALLAAYTGWQATPRHAFPVTLALAFSASLLVACFMALLFLRPLALGAAPDYSELFSASWRNALVLGFSAAATFGVAGVLTLWGQLFALIGIHSFIELFSEDWFLCPLLSVVFGLGIYIFRGQASIIDGASELLRALMWPLLPLALLVIALFLAALPFTGLEPLWQTGRGSALLMGLNFCALFFINSVYQRGDSSPYPVPLHRLLLVGIALLPAISLLALHGLYLRVEQHGWSVARCWAAMLGLLLALYSIGYAASVIRYLARWPRWLAKVNVPLGWLVALLMLAANSPLLDFRMLSVASQRARLESGALELAALDFRYVNRHLARPGHLWTRTLLERYGEADPELAAAIREGALIAPGHELPPPPSPADMLENARYLPQPFELPEDLRRRVLSDPRALFSPLGQGLPVVFHPPPPAAFEATFHAEAGAPRRVEAEESRQAGTTAGVAGSVATRTRGEIGALRQAGAEPPSPPEAGESSQAEATAGIAGSIAARPLGEAGAPPRGMIAGPSHVPLDWLGQLPELTIARADLDRDGEWEYVFVLASDSLGLLMASGFRRQDGEWRSFGMVPLAAPAKPRTALANGEMKLASPRYQDLRIGDVTLRVGAAGAPMMQALGALGMPYWAGEGWQAAGATVHGPADANGGENED